MNKMLWIITTALLMVMLTVYAQASVGELHKNVKFEKELHQLAGMDRDECQFASEGVVDGDWKLHRILKSEEALAGANDMGTLLAQYQELRLQGRCH